MKRSWKWMAAVGCCALGAGILLCAVGSMLGAKTITIRDGEVVLGDQLSGFTMSVGIGGADEDSLKLEGDAGLPQDLSVDSLELSPTVGTLTVKAGEEWKLTYNLRNPEYLTWKQNGSTLEVRYEQPGWMGQKIQGGQIELTVPQELLLQNLKVDVGVGDTTIRSLHVQQADLVGGVGDMTAEELTVDGNFSVESGVGNTELEGAFNGEVEIHTGVGDVEIAGNFSRGLSLEAGVGNTEVEVRGAKQDDFDYDIDAGMGDVSVEGISMGNWTGGEYVTDNQKGRQITIDGGIGTVEVSFTD